MLGRLSEGAATVSKIDFTHEANARSWVAGAADHPDFPVQNLPFGVFSAAGSLPRCGVAIGDHILDLAAAAGILPSAAADVASSGAAASLNPVFAHGAAGVDELRKAVFSILTDASRHDEVTPLLVQADACEMYLPFEIGDYTDFYTGIHHAENIGRQLRPDNPLMPNYKYVPIGYHGRSSSIRPSGVDVRRPLGQTKAPDAATPPVYGPTRRLDYELEMAIWVGKGNSLGQPIAIGDAGGHIAGLSLLNDWSARDVQAWEYQPLGPFLAKNFHSTVSPWVVTAQALAPFRVAQPARADSDPAPLPHLWDASDQAAGAFAIMMDVRMRTAKMRAENRPAFQLSKGSMTAMYWTPAQLIAHHASSGCNLAIGDLLGTGTLSGSDKASMGSMMEISLGGREPIGLPGGETRIFLEDGDEVVMGAYAEREGFRRIGFGECRACVVGA